MKNTGKKILVFGIVLTLAFFLFAPNLMAQEATDENQCVIELRPYLKEEGKNLLDFMDQHYKQAKSTVLLTPLAIAKYEAYKDMVNKKLEVLYALIKSGRTQQDTLSEFLLCQKELKEHLFIMDNIISDHIRRNSSAKKTFMILSKYQAINEKLSQLSRDVGELKGYFELMDTKLPGFVPKCVKQ